MEYFAEAIKVKEDSLEHHGVLGQKWGIRRYQNKDGSLTAEGKKRAAEGAEGVSKVLKKGQADARNVRIAGKAKGLAAYTTSTIGGAVAGGALGSTTGPAGTIAGATTGGLTGAIAGRAANAIIKMHANEKAAALSQEYQLLGQKMMEEYSGKKVSEISNSKPDPNMLNNLLKDNKSDVKYLYRDEIYGGFNMQMKSKLNVNVSDYGIDKGDSAAEKDRIDGAIKVAKHVENKENLDKIKDNIVKEMMKDSWGEGEKTEEGLKKNLRVYGMHVSDKNGDTVYGEINCEHRNMFDPDNAPYGDHSIDVEFSYDTKTKKMSTSGYSING